MIAIKQFQPHIPYTKEDLDRMEVERLEEIEYLKWIEELDFEVGDSVLFEGEICEIIHIFDTIHCVLKHKWHCEEHLLKYCKKV